MELNKNWNIHFSLVKKRAESDKGNASVELVLMMSLVVFIVMLLSSTFVANIEIIKNKLKSIIKFIVPFIFVIVVIMGIVIAINFFNKIKKAKLEEAVKEYQEAIKVVNTPIEILTDRNCDTDNKSINPKEEPSLNAIFKKYENN